jgi:hypothetical protein
VERYFLSNKALMPGWQPFYWLGLQRPLLDDGSRCAARSRCRCRVQASRSAARS